MQTGWKIIVMIGLAVLGLAFFPVCSMGINKADTGGVPLPESGEGRLPSGKTLIRLTQEIYRSREFKLSSPVKSRIEQFYKWLGEQLKRLARLLFKQKENRPVGLDWTEILKVLSVPIILLTIGFILFHFGTRLRRDIRETQSVAKATAESWRGLIREALLFKDKCPREALHDLLQAVIRRYIGLGVLPDDPTLTVREIERLLGTKSIAREEYESFGAFRDIYESVYYGGRAVEAQDWKDILQEVGVIVGEAVA